MYESICRPDLRSIAAARLVPRLSLATTRHLILKPRISISLCDAPVFSEPWPNMLPTNFPRFADFPFELRSRIWEYSTALHIQIIAKRRPPYSENRLPPWFQNPWDDGRTYPGEASSALSVRVRDPYEKRKRRFEEDEFESFVDCFPLSAVCREARTCVAKFLQPLVPHVTCEYDTSPLWSLKPPEDGSQPVVIRNMRCRPEAGNINYFFPRPTTLTVEMRGFKSAQEFINDIFLFFGNRIQRLILGQVVQTSCGLPQAYWAVSKEARTATDAPWRQADVIEFILVKDSRDDHALISVTRNGKVHISESFWRTGGHLPSRLAYHFLKLNQIFNVPSDILPHLEHIEVNLEVQGWHTRDYSKFVMMYKRDIGELILTSAEPLRWPSIAPPFQNISSVP